ncbi:MAG: protease Lon-related BREX system protein BrxL [Promethearchaeota archaeon]
MELDELDKKILRTYPGLIVRKDLAAKLKNAYPVPTYVLEFLLGRYCSNPNEEVIEIGLKKVKSTLEEHYLDPSKIEIIKSKIREQGRYKILDRLKVRLVASEDKYWGSLASMNLNFIHIDEALVRNNERLLLDGVWGIIEIGYDPGLSHKGRIEPFYLASFNPVQLSSQLAEKLIEKRHEFNKEEWISLLLRSVGLEPSKFSERQRFLLLLRLVPFVERNINSVEFGPRSTGKSFSYRELSPHSLLISGGGTSIANLFASNVGAGKPGLISYFDVIAFDEVAGLVNFRDTQQLQIFKDYMESGIISRGKGEFSGMASLVFIGNMDMDIQTALKNYHLFISFPYEMQDLAFLDRFHIYLPGWELPRFKSDMFTSHFGLIVDLLAEYFQSLRYKSFISSIEEEIIWGKEVDQRDKVRVKAVTSGLLKLIYPDGNFTLEELEECVKLALESRRRVKEQLKKMGSVEYRKTNLSYIRKKDNQEIIVTTPEMELANRYSPLDTNLAPGIGFTIGLNGLDRYSLYRIEVGLRKGRGKWNATGLAGKPIMEALVTVRDYLKANLKKIHPEIEEHQIKNNDVHVQIVDLMQAHQGSQTGLGFFITVVSKFLNIPIKEKTIIVGEMTISGALIPIQNLAELILIGKECGAKTLLIPDISKPLLSLVPADILENINIEFYSDPIEAWDKSKNINNN